eukprot:11217069-Lingulodinium_polyedra.AAC.1
MEQTPGAKPATYELARTRPEQPPPLQWCHVLEFERFTAAPILAVAPLHLGLLDKGRMPPILGVRL